MSTDNDEHREFCRRQHRVMAAYLSVHAWKGLADYIVLDRSTLERWLHLRHFKSARMKWLSEDVGPWFKHQHSFFYSSSALGSLYLSRLDLNPLPRGKMSDEKRMEILAQSGYRGILFQAQDLRPAADERAIEELGKIAVGLCNLGHFDKRVSKQIALASIRR